MKTNETSAEVKKPNAIERAVDAAAKKAKAAKAVTEKKGKGKSTKTDKAESTSKGKLGEILGHSVVSVIRAMGKAGWEFDEAQDSLDHLKIAARPHTIKMGLKRGRDHDKTRRIADLTKTQLDSLRPKTAKSSKSNN